MAYLTQSRRKKLQDLCRKHDVEPDLIDIEAHYDSELTWSENLDHFHELLGGSVADSDRLAFEEAKCESAYEEELRTKHEEDLQKIASGEAEELERHYSTLHDYTRIIARGHASGLLVEGPTSCGKSYQISKVLTQEMDPSEFKVMSGYTTILQFYNDLYINREKKVIFIDDLSGIFQTNKGQSLLKSVLWSVGSDRIVSYSTTSKLITAPPTFKLEAGLIFCLNSTPKGPDWDALIARCLHYELSFTYRVMVKLIFKVALKPWDKIPRENRLEIAQYIKDNSSEATVVNLRTLIKAFQIYTYTQDRWKPLVLEMLKPDQTLQYVKELVDSSEPINDQVKKFKETCGMSRRSFFRLKKSLSAKVPRI